MQLEIISVQIEMGLSFLSFYLIGTGEAVHKSLLSDIVWLVKFSFFPVKIELKDLSSFFQHP